MDYTACLAYLHGRPRFGKKQDNSRIRALMQRLGDPQNGLRFLHVAGTNGKGSVCALTAAALQQAGYRTGLYTSPYLVRFEERIRVDGKLIPPEALSRLCERMAAAQAQLEAEGGDAANEFELTTAIGLLWFAECRCDYVVLEVGLGGRLDATNVIPAPLACCVTAIGLDHTAQLGSTLAEIAQEKAGIIKPGVPVVTPASQAPESLRVLRRVCAERGATLLPAPRPQDVRTSLDGTRFTCPGGEFFVPLAGVHQADNAACALALCRAAGLDDETIRRGFAGAMWPGRLQTLCREPLILLDSAHNPPGIAALLRALDDLVPDRKLVTLMAMMQDKDYDECVQAVAARSVRFYATQLDMPRSLSAQTLCETAAPACGDCHAVPDIPQALAAARESLRQDEVLLICGSVYLAGEMLKLF